MIISVSFEAIILATTTKEGKEGRKYYNASIFVPSSGEVGSLGCSEDAYNHIVPDVAMPQIVRAEYNDKYNSFRIVGVDDE